MVVLTFGLISSVAAIALTMPLLPRIMLGMILAVTVVVRFVDGNQKIVRVSDSTASGEDDICCVYGNCFCNSLDRALANLTSNVLINITTDVTLSSLVRVSDLENVTIIGHNNPTVNYKNVSGVQFSFCHNCIVQGITWNGCGTVNINYTKPVLLLSNSSNVTIQNCFFQHSVGQSIVLSEVSGDVNINNCKFVNNSHYRDHGAALHYSSKNTRNPSQLVLTINNCHFSDNKMKSLVYLENRLFAYNKKIMLNNSNFCSNQGTSVYAINHKIYLNGKVLFQNNTAENGTGFYISDNSTVIFDKNANVMFTKNSANYKGGAIFLSNHSSIIYDQNSIVTFNNNSAIKGTIYSDARSDVTFKGNCQVSFSGNSANQSGAAVYSDKSQVTFTGNSNVTFSSNYVSTKVWWYYQYGGIMYSINVSNISFEGNSTTLFSDNIATNGGAIYSFDHGYITFQGNSKTTFRNNNVDYEGGAIYHKGYGSISFKGDATTVFSNNTAVYFGGAIESYRNAIISFGGNSVVTFTDNNAKYGGSIDSFSNGSISFEGHSTAEFNDNTADQGGAINSVYNGNIYFEGNSTTKFNNNSADHGGAIKSGDVSFNGNSTIFFRDNIAYKKGGAMNLVNAKLTFNDNSTVNFTNNETTIDAAIYSTGASRIMEIGHPTVCFNDHIVNWCNTTCLPTTHQIDGYVTIAVNSTGTVTCNGAQEAFTSLSRKCGFKYLEDMLVNLISNELVNISDVVISSVTFLTKLNNISIIGNNNHSIMCVNNAGLQVEQCSNVTIEGVNWIGCGADSTPVINILNSSDITLQNCLFQQSKGQAVVMFESLGDVNIDNCRFINNTDYTDHGAAIHYSSNDATSSSQITFVIGNCNFTHNEGATSLVYINAQTEDTNISLCNSSFHNNRGGSVYLSSNTLHINGEVSFENNAAYDGAGIYINNFSNVTFDKNSNVKFINNSVCHSGAAVFLNDYSSVLFDQNSVVVFSRNSATQYGSAIYSSNNSHIAFTGNSNVEFNNNAATNFNGTVYSEHNSSVYFEENSTVAFHNNTGYNGGAILSHYNSIIIFEGNSTVTFNNNEAYNSGGAIFSNNGTVTIKGNSTVTFTSNIANQNGGAMHCQCELDHHSYMFGGNSITPLNDNETINGSNETMDGRGMYYCIISIFEFANVTFKNNTVHQSGGAVYCGYYQIFMHGGNSTVTFSDNKAKDGGAVHAFSMSKIIFKENSSSVFSNNRAINGGTILSKVYSDISFMGTSTAMFNNSVANYGGIFYLTNSTTLAFNDSVVISFNNNRATQNGGVLYSVNSFVLCNENSTLSLAHNEATINGGVMYCGTNSNISFSEFTNVSFNDNKAINGGVLFANNNSEISFEGNSSVTFIKNEARSNGGAGYFSGHCSVTLKQNAKVTFQSNNAIFGGALCVNNNTNITFIDNSIALFKDNIASNDGGAIYILTNSGIMVNDNTTITFTANNAQYGGAMFFDTTNTTLKFTNNGSDINFNSNAARIAGDYMYFDSTGSSSSCLNNRIIDIKNIIKRIVTTPPSKIQFFAPATCIEYDNKTGECNTYYLKHIMLGEEINLPVCVSNYCDQPSYSTQFRLHGENNQNYSISGSNQILLSCNYSPFHGISIIGNDSLSKSSNYTINIILHDDRNSDWKQVSVNLTVELSSCHPGFWQDPTSKKCECYNNKDIVFCSGSNSTIKRGYWFGKVTEKPTVTVCPVNYCDFTCCEASNGYYHLSPARDNQCRSHRDGTACGSCVDGYTLSFDSTECVKVDSCTAGQKVLVILLTVIYWIVMVTLVFAMMYYKVGIGYLYSITYYYSIVDILLSKNLHASRGLYLTVSIISSFSKITPQFLGELCLTTGMSGIDQYFIHFVHPSAVILILVIISLSARSSRRISAIISRGIIHVICLLLLLSYTSIASTSLQLMRPLMFHDIDKIYTYLSPNIEYFHGRHLAYGIVALLCTVTIVLGLPLLITLEPFLNRKINFIKIKPLLDQFQGCYKDKYRCFAGYYMICRLLIITIVIANTTNKFVANYFLTVVCVITELIHVTVKPYNKEILNKFDSIILLLIIFVAELTLLDDTDSPSVITTVYVLFLIPLLIFFGMIFFLHKDDLKKIIKYFTFKDESPNGNTVIINNNNNKEVPMREFDLIVDDSMRTNATICDIK